MKHKHHRLSSRHFNQLLIIFFFISLLFTVSFLIPMLIH